MIRCTSLLLLCCWAATAWCQNLFDAEHTSQYATHLFQAGEYKLAAEEFERLAFLQPGNEQARYQLVRSHRKAGNPQTALFRLEQYFPADSGLTGRFAGEKARLLILTGQLNGARSLLASPLSLDQREHLSLQVTTELLDSKWKAANGLLTNTELRGKSPELEEFATLTNKALNMKRRSPALAVGLSTVVPGLGKTYSGAWKDGLISLLFVGVTAWQSYRGFNQNGIESAYGWTFASLSFAFYIGNLYGSGKAAQKYNRDQEHNIHHRAEDLFGRML